jgi:hypothetical protein
MVISFHETNKARFSVPPSSVHRGCGKQGAAQRILSAALCSKRSAQTFRNGCSRAIVPLY